MDRETLTPRQFFYLLCLFMLGNLVTAGGAKGVHSGWLLFLMLIPAALLTLWLFVNCRKYFDLLWPPLLVCFTLLYSALAVLLAGDSIRLFADFIVINDLNDAGAWANAGLMTVVVLLLLYCDEQSLGKLAWALLPLCVTLLLASVLLTAKAMEFRRLLPLFDAAPRQLGRGMIGTMAGVFAPAFFPIMASERTKNKVKTKAVFAAGSCISLILALLCLRDGAVLGYPAAEMFRFPGYQAAGTVRHSEILFSAVFVLAQPFRTALCLRYVQNTLVRWKPRWSLWYPPILLSLSVVSGILSWSSEQVRWRTAGELGMLGVLLAGSAAAWIVGQLRKPS